MPTYEYFCEGCKKRVSLFFLSIRQAQEQPPRCPSCEGSKLNRLVSRFQTVRSSRAGEAGGDLDSADVSDLESGDPKALARWMRRMSEETGEPVQPEMEGILDRLESGEDPEKIGSELEQSGEQGAGEGAGGEGAGEPDPGKP
jgi:putative FmdB family regulatory protein